MTFLYSGPDWRPLATHVTVWPWVPLDKASIWRACESWVGFACWGGGVTDEAQSAVVTDPAVDTQVFQWQEGDVCVYIYIFFFFLLVVLGLRCCGGFSLIWGSAGYSPLAGHRFLIAGASYCGARAPEHRLMVVSQGLSFSHMWDLLEPGSSATLTSYVRTRGWGIRGGCLLLVFSWERRGSQSNGKTLRFPHGTSTKLHINVFSFSRQH